MLQNLSNFRARYIYITPVDPNVTVSPGSLTTGGINPGATSTDICVTLFGSGAVQGSSVLVYVRICDSTFQHCCFDTVRVELPRCGHEVDCCSNFRKNLSLLTNSASSSGFASLRGWMSAGPAAMTGVSATLVSSTVNGQPVYGYFNSGLLYNPMGPGIVIPPPYGAELRWTGSPVNMSPYSQFYFSMKFPPLGSNLSRDTLRYCIRFRWTDANCVTCDTLVCFQRVRIRLFGFGATAQTGKNNSGGIAGAGTTPIAGSLFSNDSGSIQLVLPNVPKDMGTVTYVGMAVRAALPISSATETESGFFFHTEGGIAASEFRAGAGTRMALGMRYPGLGGRESLEHNVIIRYVLATMPHDTLEEEVVVTLRRNPGGDAVEPQYAGFLNVKTYAIHVRNANASGEKLDRLVITARNGVKIVAIGPTADEHQATVQFGVTSEGRSFVSEATGGGDIELAAGTMHSPIFLTLAGVDEELYTATLGFATLNASGQVVSEGELIVSEPLSTRKEEEAETGSLALTAYPNPAQESATIHFTLPANEKQVTLVVTDATGREVTRLIDGESLGSGEHMVFFNTAELPSGSYFYTLRTGGASQTRSLNIAR
jgi:hypothetical protein